MKSRAFQQQPVQRPCVRRKHDEFRVLKKASGAETQEVMTSSEGRVGRQLSGGETQVTAVLPGLEVVKRASEPATVARGPSPIDEVLVLVALHLVLNGGLQVPDALER